MDDALTKFHGELARAYTHAGRPSSRTIRDRVGGKISHTPIAEVFRFDRLPTLSTLQVVLEGLGVEQWEADRIIELWHDAWAASLDGVKPLSRFSIRDELEDVHEKLDEILALLRGRSS